MKKTIRSSAALILCFALLFSVCVSSSGLEAQGWDTYWKAYTEEGAAVKLAPGSDETERYLSWYSALDADDPVVYVADNENMTGAVSFKGTFVETNQGDRRNQVIVTGLEEGKTYYYTCTTGSVSTEVYSFSTVIGNDFSALYVTDIHVAGSDTSEDDIKNKSYKFNTVLETAKTKSDYNLVISAGDQASLGKRSEYEGIVSSPVMKTVSFATCIGNHDIKYTDYRFFHFEPNEKTTATSYYQGGDYWYVKGDALFMVLNSNCCDINAHRRFIKNAIKANDGIKWRVLTFHHDLYGARIPHRESENKLLRLLYVPLCDEFAIDLVLLGHSHYWTISNVCYNGKTVTSTKGVDSVTDAQGTIFMVSGSINNPRIDEDGTTPPLGENIGHDYLTEEMIYNILDFSEDSITIKSYTVESDELFSTFTINKTTDEGGHPDKIVPVYNILFRALSTVYSAFDVLVRSIKFVVNN